LLAIVSSVVKHRYSWIYISCTFYDIFGAIDIFYPYIPACGNAVHTVEARFDQTEQHFKQN